MEYWQGVMDRISVPGLVLVLIGAGISFGAKRLAPLVFKNPEKAVLPLKFGGLALAAAGALLTLL